MVHFGHANALRQAKEMGDYLVVGVHTDEEIRLHKGPPVFTEQERYAMVRAIKWVDEVVEGAPYVTSVPVLNEYQCDYCVHGDDITMTADGRDTYENVKLAGRYKECKRTPGVSTTDLVGRMLLMSRQHHRPSSDDGSLNDETKTASRQLASSSTGNSPWTRVSTFLPSTRTIMQFTEGRVPTAQDKIIYVCGAFDMFHIGHLSFVQAAASLGTYLIVGMHDDATVNRYKGQGQPVMTMHERVLSALAYKPVSEVIFNAPYTVTEDIIERYNISLVCHGSRSQPQPDPDTGEDPYLVPKRLGKFVSVDSGSDMTTEKIILRILKNRVEYEMRNQKKERKETAAYEALLAMQQNLRHTRGAAAPENGHLNGVHENGPH